MLRKAEVGGQIDFEKSLLVLEKLMLKGNLTVSRGRWGRVRIPSDISKIFKEEHDNEVFVTLIDDRTVKIYPLTVWLELFGGLSRGKRDDSLLRRFLMKMN